MKISHILIAALAAIGFVLYPKALSDKARGIRNNNPLNIEAGDDWIGLGGDDGRFAIFETALHGIRAAARVMRTKARRGVVTIREIISEWAPPTNGKGEHENHTENYINRVSEMTGIDVNTPLDSSTYPAVIAAMIRMENGENPYSDDLIKEGFQWGFYG